MGDEFVVDTSYPGYESEDYKAFGMKAEKKSKRQIVKDK